MAVSFTRQAIARAFSPSRACRPTVGAFPAGHHSRSFLSDPSFPLQKPLRLSPASYPSQYRLAVRSLITHAMPSLKLGAKAPAFQLPEPLTGKIWTLEDFKDAACLWVMFLCNKSHSIAYLKPHLSKLAREYVPKNVGVVAIQPNSVKVEPEDGPEKMAADALKMKYPFPYLYDEMQEVSRAFGPVCIPDFFVFKKDEENNFELVYHGQIDESRAINSRPITYKDIRECLDALLAGQPVDTLQKPSTGCQVKWHPKE